MQAAQNYDRYGIRYSYVRHFPHRNIEEEREIWERAVRLGYVSNESSQVQQSLADADVYIFSTGLDQVPRQYRLLAQHTQSFIDIVSQIAKLPECFSNAAMMLNDFTTKILFSDGSLFEHMLNSQRGHIFWLLDDGLLRICLDEWERPSSPGSNSETPWNITIAPLREHIAQSFCTVPNWARGNPAFYRERALGWSWGKRPLKEFTDLMEGNYFVRTRMFLAESLKVFYVRRKVNACLRGRVPKELADEIIEDVLIYEGFSPGTLRMKYLPKGKGKAL
jgi:hypothetical protein